MNTNSEDVVKNVESNKVESTSNEQRQTNKPIVISRRRLLRAGVAGIPVVLTMAGIAPAAGIQTEPSAASGLIYGGNKVRGRFQNTDGVLRDNMVWSDHNGFVLQSGGGVYTKTFHVSSSESNDSITLTLDNGEYIGPEESRPVTIPSRSLEVSVTLPSLDLSAYSHKTGVWYTDRLVRNAASPVDLLAYIKTITLTITDGATTTVGTYSNGTSLPGDNTANLIITPDEPVFTPSNPWYNTGVLGYALDGDRNEEIPYYRLPETATSEINKVEYKATLVFDYTVDNIKYSCNQSVTIPLVLDVTGIPPQINPGGV